MNLDADHDGWVDLRKDYFEHCWSIITDCDGCHVDESEVRFLEKNMFIRRIVHGILDPLGNIMEVDSRIEKLLVGCVGRSQKVSLCERLGREWISLLNPGGESCEALMLKTLV